MVKMDPCGGLTVGVREMRDRDRSPFAAPDRSAGLDRVEWRSSHAPETRAQGEPFFTTVHENIAGRLMTGVTATRGSVRHGAE
jgi:hypothetical protein